MDREKVIKGLELCEISYDNRCYEKECPYYGQECTVNSIPYELMRDALELLKEQEAVAPVMVPHSLGIAYNCGSCGTEIAVIRDTVSADYARNSVRYCQRCGKAVKW